MSAPPTSPASLMARLVGGAAGVLAVLAAWGFADLYLRVDLPGARHLVYWAFQAVTRPLTLLGSDSQEPLYLLAKLWVAGAVLSLPVAAARGWFWRLSCVGAAAGLVLSLGTTFLMERSLAAGLVAVVGVASLAPRPPPSGRLLPSWAWAPWLVAVGLLSLYYPYSLVFSVPEGYPILEAAGAVVRNGGSSPVDAWLALCAVVAAGSWLAVAKGAWRRLAPAGAGLLVWAVMGVLMDDVELWETGAITLLAAGGAAAWASGHLSAPLGWDPRTWVLRAMPLALGGLFLFGHTYAARVFLCPEPQDHPELSVIGDTAGVFRLQLNEDGSHAVMSVRSRRRVESLAFTPEPQPIETAYQLATWPTEPSLWAIPEDLAWAPDPGRFFVMLSMRDETTWLGNTDGEKPPIRAALLTLDDDADTVLDVAPFHDLCWTSALEWSGQSLYVGCERPGGLFRWRPKPGGVRAEDIEPAVQGDLLGDVESIAFHPDGARFFTASLWSSPYVHELATADLSIQRRVFVGGGHYVLAHDPTTEHLFASSFYAGRIRILDADTLELVGRIPTGLGARGLAVDPARGLVLASSLYDGRLLVADTKTGDVLRTYPVGGHVKDIAVDPAWGYAYFWSQCGLQRLDLTEATGRERRF